jgi:hypothetical protein
MFIEKLCDMNYPKQVGRRTARSGTLTRGVLTGKKILSDNLLQKPGDGSESPSRRQTRSSTLERGVIKGALVSKIKDSNELAESGLLDYIIDPEIDYFNEFNKNYTTILNNESAALKRVIELLEGTNIFQDPDWNPVNGGADLIYYKGKAPSSSHPNPAEIEWPRPCEWIEEECVFVSGDISSHDVQQGTLGDCWFIGALSVLATRNELIYGSIPCLDSISKITRESCVGISKGVYPPLFHCFAKHGLYVFRFFKNCAWRWVIIDDRLPVFAKPGYEK